MSNLTDRNVGEFFAPDAGRAIENIKALLSDIQAERRERGTGPEPFSPGERERFAGKALELLQALSEENADDAYIEVSDGEY
ncbi:MAG: hypothetical protein ABSG73_01145 [Candidatus Aminicenantales bacterium]|jgi:hypothetical protein